MNRKSYNDYKKYAVLPPNSKYSGWIFAIPKKHSNNHPHIHTVRTGGINEEGGENDELFFIYSEISSSWNLTKR